MAFGKITKNDLVEAGLDPDKIKEFQEKGVTKDDLAAMKTELTAAMNTTVTDLIKNSFTELEAKLKPPEKKTESTGDGITQRTPEDDFTDFTTDPVGFVKKQTGSAAAFAAVEVKKTQIQLAVNQLSQTLPGFRNPTLKAEIEEEWKKYTPEAMVRSNTDPVDLLKKVHNMVMGAHHDEIIQDTNKREGKYNLVHSGSSGGTGSTINNTSTSDTKPQLTDAQKKVAKQFGLTDDEYLQQEKDMRTEEEKRHSLAGVA